MRKNQIYSKKKIGACMLTNLRIAPVATVFSQTEIGKSETLFKSKFCTVEVDCSEVFILYLPYLPGQNTSKGCSYLLTKVSLDKKFI